MSAFKLRVQRHALPHCLASSEDYIRQESNMLLDYLDLLEQPGVFYSAPDDDVKRKLLVAYFSQIWIEDDCHEVTPETQPRTMVARLHDALHREIRNAKGTESILGAFHSLFSGPDFLGACSSNTTLVPQAGIEPATYRLEGERSIR